MQAIRRMREQVPVLVHGAALHWHAVPNNGDRAVEPRRAIDDEEFRPLQTASGQIVEDTAPSFGAFTAHALDREQNFLSVGTHAQHDEQRNRSGFAVEPNANNRAVEDQADDRLVGQRAGVPGIPVGLHLAPGAAHGILAHRAAKQRRQRPTDATRVGPGQIRGGDQTVSCDRAALVGLQRLALPFGRTAARSVQSSARHGYLNRAERSQQRARTVTVAMAGNRLCRAGRVARARRNTPIARSRQHRIELLFHHRLDEIAHPAADAGFDRVKPVVEKLGGRLRCSCRGIRLRDMLLHGVVSSPARQRQAIRG